METYGTGKGAQAAKEHDPVMVSTRSARRQCKTNGLVEV